MVLFEAGRADADRVTKVPEHFLAGFEEASYWVLAGMTRPLGTMSPRPVATARCDGMLRK